MKLFRKTSKRFMAWTMITVTLFIGTGLIYLFNPFNKSVQAVWLDDNWAYRETVPLTSTNGSAQSNVFVSFTLDTATLITASKLQSACQDIRITDINGKLLPYHIGRTNACNASNTTIDFLLSSFPDSVSTYYVYYGNPSAVSKDVGAFSQSQAANYSASSLGSEEKTPGPVMYYKFDEGTGTSSKDSGSNANTGTLGGATVPTWQTEDQCISGKCLYFGGVTSKVTGSKVALNIQTVSFWIRPNTIATQGIFNLDGGTHKISTNAGGVISATGFTSPTYYLNGIAVSSLTLVQHQWNFVTITTGTGFNSTSSFTIGTDGTNFQKGFIDEVKFDSYVRSAAQVATDYDARSLNKGAAEALGANTQNGPNGNLSNGLVGYWKMDETSWTNNCSATSILDASGNANNGRACPNATGPTGGAAGKFGNGGLFDGTNDSVNVPDNNSLDAGTGNLTLTAWVKRTGNAAFNNGMYIFDKQNVPGALTAGYTFNMSTSGSANCDPIAGTGGLCFYIADGTRAFYMISANPITADSIWHHVAVVVDRTNQNASNIYIDGVVQSITRTGTLSSIGDASNAAPLCLGADETGAGCRSDGLYDWNGSLDEARVYNRAMSSAEISQLYDFAPGPVGYWKMDEGTGSSANDGSSNGDTMTWAGTLGSQWTTGMFGKAGNFNGTDNYITAGQNHTVLDFGGSGETIEAWIYQTSNTGSQNIAYYNPEYALNINGGTIRVANQGNFIYNNSTTTISTNTWTHIAAVHDGNQTWTIYKNGAKDSTVTLSQSAASNTHQLTIGAGTDEDASWATFFKGKLDDVKIYNYARTGKQVVEDMNAGHPAPGSPVGTPLGYWKFDEGADNTCSGGSNDVCNSGNGGNALDGAQSNMSVPATSTSGWTQAGKFNKALIFDKTDDIINVGSATAIDDLPTSTGMSLSAWIYPLSIGEGNQGIIMIKATNTAPANGWIFKLTATNALQFKADYNTTDLTVTSSNNAISLNTWQHVLVTWTGSSTATNVHMYVNGVEVTYQTQTNASGSYNTDAAQTMYLGNDSGTASTFEGTLDEMKIYNSVLTASQVKLDMNRGQAQILGALSDNSSYQKQAANQEYCIPGDATSCAAPVGRWNFEEGTGSTVNDSSGNSNNGTFNSAPISTTLSSGKFGKAFNGGGDSNYVKVTSASSLSPSSAITVEAWINSTTTLANSGILAKWASQQGDNTSSYALIMNPFGSADTIDFSVGTSGGQVNAQGSTNVDNGKWHHVVGTYDGTTARVYVDGKQDGSANQAGTINTGTSEVWIGLYGGGQHFPGKIDAVRIYNYLRTPAQIAWDYNRGGPIAWWKFDECQGTTINDSSGNSNTGTLTVGGSGTQASAGTCTTSSTAWLNGITGKFNYSLNFDGTDDYVNVPNSSSLQIASDFTLSAWVYLTASNGNTKAIIEKRQGGNAGDYYLGLSGSFAFVGFYSGGNFHSAIDNTTTISTNTWHHITGVFDDTNNIFRIYVDGRQIFTQAETNSPTATTNQLNIGVDEGVSLQDWFPGQLDDVRVFNYALTATQVKNLYNGNGIVRFGPSTGAP